jgi:hypothetical protein
VFDVIVVPNPSSIIGVYSSSYPSILNYSMHLKFHCSVFSMLIDHEAKAHTLLINER